MHVQAFGHRVDVQVVEQRPRAFAQHHRRDVQQQLVDQARGEERAGERGARFDLHFVDLALGEQLEHRGQVHAARFDGHRDVIGFDAARHARIGGVDVKRRRAAFANVPALHGRQARIEHDAQRRHERRVVAEAHGEMRIVHQHGARAGEDRAGACAPLLHVASRGFAADPFRIAGGQRAAAVEARRELHAHPRTPAFDARQESLVELARLRFHQADVDLDAGGAQLLETAAVDLRERIARSRRPRAPRPRRSAHRRTGRCCRRASTVRA